MIVPEGGEGGGAGAVVVSVVLLRTVVDTD